MRSRLFPRDMLSTCKIAYISVNNCDRPKILHIQDQRVKIHKCTYFCLLISTIKKKNNFGYTPHLNKLKQRTVCVYSSY